MHRLEPSVLDPRLLIAAYRQGFFPMATENGRILWYDPNPRAILPLDRFHASRRLLRTVRTARFEARVDTSFRSVINACAAPAPGREQTWISSDIVNAYCQLHQLGLAHSLETWQEGALVGGVYGVAMGGLFAAESMFSRSRDASKVALVHLVERLRRGGYVLLDVQFLTPHLMRFGAVEVPRDRYKALLADALQTPAEF
jgi:leucyl/phenylalanyl-tRNA--protein transferase